MKIKNIIWQNRRDFEANYICENCGEIETGEGYDDRNFHDNALPNIKCKKCGKSRNDLGIIGEFTIEVRKAHSFRCGMDSMILNFI